jgi:hypothetical protein
MTGKRCCATTCSSAIIIPSRRAERGDFRGSCSCFAEEYVPVNPTRVQRTNINMEHKKPIAPQDAARIQSAEAKKHQGNVPEDSFAARAQSAASGFYLGREDNPDPCEWMPDFD